MALIISPCLSRIRQMLWSNFVEPRTISFNFDSDQDVISVVYLYPWIGLISRIALVYQLFCNENNYKAALVYSVVWSQYVFLPCCETSHQRWPAIGVSYSHSLCRYCVLIVWCSCGRLIHAISPDRLADITAKAALTCHLLTLLLPITQRSG